MKNATMVTPMATGISISSRRTTKVIRPTDYRLPGRVCPGDDPPKRPAGTRRRARAPPGHVRSVEQK